MIGGKKNLASNRYVTGKAGGILLIFSDNCGYSTQQAVVPLECIAPALADGDPRERGRGLGQTRRG